MHGYSCEAVKDIKLQHPDIKCAELETMVVSVDPERYMSSIGKPLRESVEKAKRLLKDYQEKTGAQKAVSSPMMDKETEEAFFTLIVNGRIKSHDLEAVHLAEEARGLLVENYLSLVKEIAKMRDGTSPEWQRELIQRGTLILLQTIDGYTCNPKERFKEHLERELNNNLCAPDNNEFNPEDFKSIRLQKTLGNGENEGRGPSLGEFLTQDGILLGRDSWRPFKLPIEDEESGADIVSREVLLQIQVVPQGRLYIFIKIQEQVVITMRI